MIPFVGTIVNAKTYLIVGLVCLLAGALVSGWTSWHFTKGYYKNQITTIEALHKAEISGMQAYVSSEILRITKEKNEIELSLSEKRNDYNEEYQASISNIRTIVSNLRDVLLHDPGAQRPGSGSSNTASPGTTQGTGGGNGSFAGEGVLSRQSTEFLLGKAAEANAILERLRICASWEEDIQKAVKEYQEKIETQKKSRN